MDSTKRFEKLTERMGNGDIDRRSFMNLLGCAGLVAGVSGGAMTAMSTQAVAAAKELHFEGWGGVVRAKRCANTPLVPMKPKPATR